MPTATATQFNREPSRFLREAMGGATTVIESHGQPAAALIPQPAKTSGKDLAKRLSQMKPDNETATEVSKLIKGMNEAH